MRDAFKAKIWNEQDDTYISKYMKNFETSFTLKGMSYSQLASLKGKVRCWSKDHVELIFDCILRSSGDIFSNLGFIYFNYAFNPQEWYYRGDSNPFE